MNRKWNIVYDTSIHTCRTTTDAQLNNVAYKERTKSRIVHSYAFG